jgi:hypothetical protein
MKGKGVLLILLASAIPALSQIVTVNGKQVDLTPLNKWLKHPQGERPLKHWKKIIVEQDKGVVEGRPRYVIKTEDGDKLEVSLLNVPSPIHQFLDTMKAQAADLLAQESKIKETQTAIDRANAVTPVDLTTDGSGYIAIQQRQNQINMLQQQVNEAKARYDALEREWEAKVMASEKELTTVAMNTGMMYAKTPIWDCGKPQ